MSFFKNFKNVLSQSTLNNPANNFVLNIPFKAHTPALYYISSNSGVSEPFEIPLVAYHLTRKVQSDRALLEQIESSGSNNDLKVQVLEDLRVNEERLNQQLDDLRKIFKGDNLDFPIQHCVQALYSFENNDRSDVAFYEKYIFPTIRRKVQYASRSNLADLTIVLSELNYFNDSQLWSDIADNINNKSHQAKPQAVEYDGWTADTFVPAPEQKKATVFQTENERVFSEGGSVKSYIRQGIEWAYTSLLQRFIFQDTRLSSTLDDFGESFDVERYNRAIETAKNNGVDVRATEL